MESGHYTAGEVWTYGDAAALGTDMTAGTDLVGYSVEAADGGIGKVDEATYEAGSSYIVVDTGPWIFGKKVMLPARVVSRVDTENQAVYVDRTTDEIENAPEFDETRYQEQTYRDELGGYYGGPPSETTSGRAGDTL